ncbi:TerC family protein [Prochlorococcus marinus]|uniref:Membrane protein TerC, possibly involved in tellurium resistance n=1 Tax=Prochlorococcus marinus (strain MIT 9211) TaxID=93059 RepID=A9BAJ4_PROM4|nr:DUF475 domain-containing protein [Prochlorococcus marinus]ABX08856.1 Membrane protein TerC, possibly involved in tellurium resistance [Prochlorococcus marinus str. MIT 9211]
MDSASLDSLTPILDGIDRWVEIAPLLPLIIILEIVLSADNAVALASITRQLRNIELQRKALNIGIFISLILRMVLLVTANYIIRYSIVQLTASIYLFTLVIRFFLSIEDSTTKESSSKETLSMLQIVVLLAITDLAFSIDSVTAAVAISDQLLLIITGTVVGVIALRFTADFFIRWLEIFVNLEAAGYIAVGLVALKLFVQSLILSINISDSYFFIILASIFLWGFSRKIKKEDSQ